MSVSYCVSNKPYDGLDVFDVTKGNGMNNDKIQFENRKLDKTKSEKLDRESRKARTKW